jgi:hypothetical protein
MLFLLLFLMVTIPVAITIVVSARWFGIYVALLTTLALIAAANPPEPDFSSPLGGFSEAMLRLWGLIWAAAVLVKAVFIIHRAGKAGSGSGYSTVRTTLLSLAFVMLLWRPDDLWIESAITLAAATAVMIVLKAISDGLRQPRSAGADELTG